MPKAIHVKRMASLGICFPWSCLFEQIRNCKGPRSGVKRRYNASVPASEKPARSGTVATTAGTPTRDVSEWTEKRPGSKPNQTFASCEPGLCGQLLDPGARTSIIRFRSSTLANSMLTLPLRTPSEILTFVSKRSDSEDAK